MAPAAKWGSVRRSRRSQSVVPRPLSGPRPRSSPAWSLPSLPWMYPVGLAAGLLHSAFEVLHDPGGGFAVSRFDRAPVIDLPLDILQVPAHLDQPVLEHVALGLEQALECRRGALPLSRQLEVAPHLVERHAGRSEARQGGDAGDVLRAVTTVPARVLPPDRAQQTGPLVVPQGVLAQTGPCGGLLHRELPVGGLGPGRPFRL